MIDLLIDHPYTALLIAGILIIVTTAMIMITRHNYTRIVRMIDEGEKEAIEKRVEEWGEMIINNVQQQCMKRKLSLTFYVIILPIIALLMIAFSIYKLDMFTNLVITLIHIIGLFIIIMIVKFFRNKSKKKKPKKSALLVNDSDEKE